MLWSRLGFYYRSRQQFRQSTCLSIPPPLLVHQMGIVSCCIDEPHTSTAPSCSYQFSRSIGLGWGTGVANLNSPSGIAFDRGSDCIFVSDCGNHRISLFSLFKGFAIGTIASEGMDEGFLRIPRGLAWDPSTRSLFVCDSGNDRIQEFSIEGTYLSKLGGEGHKRGRLTYPVAIELDTAAGLMYISEGPSNHRLQVFCQKLEHHWYSWRASSHLQWAFPRLLATADLPRRSRPSWCCEMENPRTEYNHVTERRFGINCIFRYSQS